MVELSSFASQREVTSISRRRFNGPISDVSSFIRTAPFLIP